LSADETFSGSVDDLRRPFIRIDVAGFDDPVIAFVDTGFNGAVSSMSNRLNEWALSC
jgi:hypothetical protein